MTARDADRARRDRRRADVWDRMRRRSVSGRSPHGGVVVWSRSRRDR